MPSNISRRTLAKGIAWSTPVIAASAVVPAYASSATPPAGCYLTDNMLNAGYCGPEVAQSWIIENSTFSSTFGTVSDLKTNFSLGLRSTCNYKGSVTFKAYGVAVSNVPAPTIVLTNGETYTGAFTSANVMSGGAKTGFTSAPILTWTGMKGENANLTGAQVTVPMELGYTSPNGTLGKCVMYMKFTMTAAYSGLFRPLGTPVFSMTP